MKTNLIHSALFGVAVGDALGVPVEFRTRDSLRANPVKDMMGYMCWNQPPGTWSDDSSLTFCLADSLCNSYDLEDIAQTFARWYTEGYWGAHHEVFDIGGTTRHSIQRVIEGTPALYSGNIFETDNGNGSLMRILPLAFHLKDEPNIDKIYKIVKEVSGITHGHFRSVFSCFIYVVLALRLMQEEDKNTAYCNMQKQVLEYIQDKEFSDSELALFDRILKNMIETYNEDTIASSGYVLHSLEAAIWCLLKENTFESTVLKAVNLGGDTDTTAAIAGGLAGLLYGYDAIPKEWVDQLARKEDIIDLCDRLYSQTLKRKTNETI